MIPDAPNVITPLAEASEASSSDRKLASRHDVAIADAAHPTTPGDLLPAFTRIFDIETWRFTACLLSMGVSGCAMPPLYRTAIANGKDIRERRLFWSSLAIHASLLSRQLRENQHGGSPFDRFSEYAEIALSSTSAVRSVT